MSNRWEGLGAELLRTLGVRGAAHAFYLAEKSGFELIPVAGTVCVARSGKHLLYDGTLPVREQHAAVARALAEVLLRRARLPVHARSLDDVARELMVGPDFAADHAACDGDLEVLQRMHPYLLLTWLGDAVEALQPPNVVYLRINDG